MQDEPKAEPPTRLSPEQPQPQPNVIAEQVARVGHQIAQVGQEQLDGRRKAWVLRDAHLAVAQPDLNLRQEDLDHEQIGKRQHGKARQDVWTPWRAADPRRGEQYEHQRVHEERRLIPEEAREERDKQSRQQRPGPAGAGRVGVQPRHDPGAEIKAQHGEQIDETFAGVEQHHHRREKAHSGRIQTNAAQRDLPTAAQPAQRGVEQGRKQEEDKRPRQRSGRMWRHRAPECGAELGVEHFEQIRERPGDARRAPLQRAYVHAASKIFPLQRRTVFENPPVRARLLGMHPGVVEIQEDAENPDRLDREQQPEDAPTHAADSAAWRRGRQKPTSIATNDITHAPPSIATTCQMAWCQTAAPAT